MLQEKYIPVGGENPLIRKKLPQGSFGRQPGRNLPD